MHNHLVSRHKPVVVRLEYTPKGDVEETILVAGKVYKPSYTKCSTY